MTELVRPDLAGGLYRTHLALTYGLDVATTHSAPPLDDHLGGGTREGLILYIRTLALVLKVHNRSEDQIMFPFIQGRMPELPYDLLIAQHREMSLLLGRVHLGLERGGVGMSDAHQALVVLQTMWQPHIAAEEQHFTAAAVDVALNAQEQLRLAEMVAHHNYNHMQPIELVLPFTLYNLPAGERAILAQTMPAYVHEQWVPVDWKAQWAPMGPFFRDL